MSSPTASTTHSNPNYRRVASGDGGVTSGAATEDNNNNKPQETAAAVSPRTMQERFMDKGTALAWVLTAAFTAYWTDTRHVLLDADSNAVHFLLRLVAVGVGIQTVLTLYLTVYLPYGKQLTDSSAWAVYCPRVIPVLTAVSIISFLLLIRAVWPCFGFLSPLILSVEGLGLLFALQFVPTW